MRLSVQNISDYVAGWLTAGKIDYSVEDALNAISNAKAQINDPEDGIEAVTERMSAYHPPTGNRVSKCCHEVIVPEGFVTHYYKCAGCNKPCDSVVID